MRKIILALLLLAVLLAGGVYWLSRRAPGLLKEAIGRSLNKTVRIQAIDYRFPGTFELKGFEIIENQEPFVGGVCFAVDKIQLEVSLLSLSRKRLTVDEVDVSQAQVVVRKKNNKLYHALSDAMTRTASDDAGKAAESAGPAETGMPLAIHRFYLNDSRFQFIDYDVQETGFVTSLEQIEADFKHIAFPPGPVKTSYNIEARLPQGRQKKTAALQAEGWTVLGDYETDCLLRVSEVSLPYFRPYYNQVTPAQIEEGRLTTRAAVRIHRRLLTANVDMEVSELYFSSYELGDQLFGLKADEILNVLKDSAGKLKFQIVLQWDLADRGVEKREVIRKAIEQSLKKTLIGNVGNILEQTLQKLSDPETGAGKEDWEGALKKVKKLFR